VKDILIIGGGKIGETIARICALAGVDLDAAISGAT